MATPSFNVNPSEGSTVKPRNNGSQRTNKFYQIYIGEFFLMPVELNPDIAHFKGLDKIMLYMEVYVIANI